MKKNMLVAMGISAVVAFTATSIQAQDKKSVPETGGGGHSHFTKIPATVEGIWQAIYKQQSQLISTVAAKDLGEAHDHAFAIRDLVKALPGKVPTETKAQAEASAKEITKLAAAIDKSGAAGAQKATEENVKKLGAAIRALEAKLKPVEVKN